ncbi:hypothetical protein FOL47_010641 [Perkinsus chesapeaki]|uniref:Adenylate kinase n=1 Tax=Perkinsus chesapeaki TaxID=330153 RepID=A0A7J6L261_PERCH|nr:hypothetical protein FOL47_010641 [Perkinsus chesapeaki]
MKIFVNNADSYVGNALCADLQKILDTPTRIYATVKGGDDCQVPSPVKRIVSRRSPTNILKAVSQSDLAVFDLHTSDLEEVEFVLGRMKSYELEKPLVLVLVSTVMVWAKTKPSTVDGSVMDDSVPETLSENASDADQPEEPAVTVFTPADWCRRVPSGRYRSWKYLETLAISLNSVTNITAYVVCPGILYGNGEMTFYDDFRAAWLGESTHRIVGNGGNSIPTLHVRDLARCVKHLSAGTEAQRYVLAVDDGNTSQREILQAIVDKLGTGGKIPEIAYDDAVACLDSREPFLIDLRLEASEFLRQPEFKWWCRKGPAEEISKIVDEFCSWRNLRPLKMVLIGPPASGKSFYAAKVADCYRLVHIAVGPVIQAALDKAATLKKLIEPEEETTEPVDVETLGDRDRYILDGFPRTAEEARELFMAKEETDEGEDEEDSKKLIVDDAIRPGWAFLLQSDLDICRSRLETLTEAEVSGTHNTLDDFQRRADRWSKEIESHGSVTILDALNDILDGEKTCKGIKVDGVDVDDVVDIIAQIVEYDGCPYNYLLSKKSENDAKMAEVERQEKMKKDEEERIKNEKLKLEAAEIEARKVAEAERLKEAKRQEMELIDKHSKHLRHYLVDNVMPVLKDGILEACHRMPEDPMSFIAESVSCWIFVRTICDVKGKYKH